MPASARSILDQKGRNVITISPTVTLGEATEDMADMRTVVIVGKAQTKRLGRYVYTPRSAE